MFNLKKFLEMSEEEQEHFLQKYAWHHRTESQTLAEFHRECKSGHCCISLADLAFRLRDEASKLKSWGNAKEEVWLIQSKGAKEYIEFFEGLSGADEDIVSKRNTYFTNKASPIDFIAAALQAKEMNK